MATGRDKNWWKGFDPGLPAGAETASANTIIIYYEMCHGSATPYGDSFARRGNKLVLPQAAARQIAAELDAITRKVRL
jgi:hypothetical protein